MALSKDTPIVNTKVMACSGPAVCKELKMFSNGNATVFVSDMDRSVNFYTKILGLKLAERFGDHWASIEAGKLAIGLHPASNKNQAGKNGSIIIGLELTGNIEEAIAKMTQQGVQFRGGVSQDNVGETAYFEDPDGNLLYMIQLKQWTKEGNPAEHARQTR
jgi:catechol 2,3-dioxygenase-like lactoylglutathione lyase family enzyme